MIGKNKTLKGPFSKGLYTLTNFPLGLKVVSEKLYLSDAMFSWSQISEMTNDEERGKNIPPLPNIKYMSLWNRKMIYILKFYNSPSRKIFISVTTTKS